MSNLTSVASSPSSVSVYFAAAEAEKWKLLADKGLAEVEEHRLYAEKEKMELDKVKS